MTADSAQLRLARALAPRVGPGTGTSYKTLARAIARSEGSIIAYARAERAASVDTVDAMAKFFAQRHGDTQFLPEVFGRAAAGPADICLWATDDGALSAAPRGPAEFVRSSLALDTGVTFDAVAYAVRMLGWVAVTLRPDGSVSIRRHLTQSCPEAAARIAAWLVDQGRGFTAIGIDSLQGETWTSRGYDTVRAAVAALTTPVPAVAEQISTGISTARLALDSITDPAQAALLRRWDGSSTGLEAMLAAVEHAGAMARASILRADDDGWTVLSAGAGTHLRRDLSGRPLRVMRDQNYVDVVDRQLGAARVEGQPRLDDLRITAAGDAGAYRRLALPVTGLDGIAYCLTMSDIYAPPQRAVIQ